MLIYIYLIKIAQAAVLRPIIDVARDAGVKEEEIDLYGKYKAKIHLDILDRLAAQPDGKYVEIKDVMKERNVYNNGNKKETIIFLLF